LDELRRLGAVVADITAPLVWFFRAWFGARRTTNLTLRRALSYVRITRHEAGFGDRSVLSEGAAADVVVYDLNGLGIEPEWVGEIVHDLPGGEWRRVQRPKGYRSIIVNGVETFSEGNCTGATPGKLLRNGHA
jgi:N-acyl-D-aspartate/D-glutamate deacylase